MVSAHTRHRDSCARRADTSKGLSLLPPKFFLVISSKFWTYVFRCCQSGRYFIGQLFPSDTRYTRFGQNRQALWHAGRPVRVISADSRPFHPWHGTSRCRIAITKINKPIFIHDWLPPIMVARVWNSQFLPIALDVTASLTGHAPKFIKTPRALSSSYSLF